MLTFARDGFGQPRFHGTLFEEQHALVFGVPYVDGEPDAVIKRGFDHSRDFGPGGQGGAGFGHHDGR